MGDCSRATGEAHVPSHRNSVVSRCALCPQLPGPGLTSIDKPPVQTLLPVVGKEVCNFALDAG